MNCSLSLMFVAEVYSTKKDGALKHQGIVSKNVSNGVIMVLDLVVTV